MNKLFEGVIYNTSNVNKDLLQNFLSWLDENEIDYNHDNDENELEIYNELSISKDNHRKLRDYVIKLNLRKIWEDTSSSSSGTTMASLQNTIGQGAVKPPTSSSTGSGDVFSTIKVKKDNEDEIDYDEDEDEDIEKKKKRKKKSKNENILSFFDFVKNKL